MGDERMRVCLWTDSKLFAGTERHMLDLATSLRGIGVDASIACPVPSPLAERANQASVPVHDVPNQGTIDHEAHARLARLFDEGGMDLLHSHNGRTALNAAIALRGRRGGRCVMTQHFLEPAHVGRWGFHRWVSRLAHRWVDRRTSAHIAISECVRAKMLERGGIPPERIHVVRNGAVAPDPASLRSAAEVRAELGVSHDAPLVVCAARLEAEKDIAVLIGAMETIARRHPLARCVVAGDGSQRAALEAQITGAGLEGRVRLLRFRQDVPSLIAAGDLFVLPSAAEPFGLVVIEAMALGKPVIATRAGGPVEIVADGETGLLVKPSDAGALAEGIAQLLADAGRREAMGVRGRERFDRLFTAERMAREMCEVYRSVMQR